MDWDKLNYFYHIARCGSFSAAADQLGLRQSTLSRSIMKLEQDLNARLFNRSKLGVILTQAGEVLYRHTINMIAEAETAKTIIGDSKDKVQGTLKLTTTYGFASTFLFPRLNKFLKLYPDLKLNIICDDENLDLKARQADVAIRPYDPNARDTVQTFLLDTHFHLYASANYLKKFGTPRTIQDLDHHRLIIFTNPSNALSYEETGWILGQGLPAGKIREPYLTVNSVECLIQAAAADLGIIALSEGSSLLKQASLQMLLPDVDTPCTGMYLIYPAEIKNVKSIQALEEFLKVAFSRQM